MRISDSPRDNTILTTGCAKMTEESRGRHGVNGNDGGGAKEEGARSAYGQGGRLKFFKDGKFILELARAREGERVSWVSVPRKTFWPPQGTAASTPSYRQESSTSLSVSDDNSSVQSSPWQRDHSWKQTTPRRNLSVGLSFCYWRRGSERRSRRRSDKRRRPYSSTPEPTDSNDGGEARNEGRNEGRRKSLMAIVQSLADRCTAGTPPRAEFVVSPRKRFLREMERDKCQPEDACQKRSRNKPQPPKTPAVTTASPVNGTTATIVQPVEQPRPTANSSYSITSLLSEDNRRRCCQSPPSEAVAARGSPSQYVVVPSTRPQYCSPTPPSEDGWYSESVDRLRSIELSQVNKRALSAYPYHHHFVSPYILPYSTLPPSYYPPPPPPTHGVYGRGFPASRAYTAPPLPLTTTATVRHHDSPSCSWSAEQPTRDSEHRDANVTDMPLNLSKHAS